ncbi:MAG: YicC family protein, partial [Ruminococcus sp.]|nr:YicC family protein [Ruminococcus sp.]
DLTLSKLIKLPDIFSVQKTPDDEEQIWFDISETAKEALAKFIAMRETEGEKLRADILEKTDIISSMVKKVEELSPVTTENYRKRLFNKLSEILESQDIDQQRIITESAVFAEKIAVDEETVRLKSHILQLTEMLDSSESIGRKLDFIVQEMNREVNTIGSKAQDLEITKLVVDMKAELEKIREQIQNIE